MDWLQVEVGLCVTGSAPATILLLVISVHDHLTSLNASPNLHVLYSSQSAELSRLVLYAADINKSRTPVQAQGLLTPGTERQLSARITR